jgi:hypothetical protein
VIELRDTAFRKMQKGPPNKAAPLHC